MDEIPITVDFNSSKPENIVGFARLTPEFKKRFEQWIVDHYGTQNMPVFSIGYISEAPDENGKIKSAELIELSAIPVKNLMNRANKWKKR